MILTSNRCFAEQRHVATTVLAIAQKLLAGPNCSLSKFLNHCSTGRSASSMFRVCKKIRCADSRYVWFAVVSNLLHEAWERRNPLCLMQKTVWATERAILPLPSGNGCIQLSRQMINAQRLTASR